MRNILKSFAATLLVVVSPPAGSAQTASAPARACQVEIEPGKIRAKVGDRIELHILVRDAVDLFSAPFHLLFDSNLVSIDEILESDFLGGDGKRTIFLKSVQPARGRAIVGLARLGEVGGRTGSGKLVTVKLITRKKGSAELMLERLDFRDSRLKSIPVKTNSMTIVVE